MLFDLLAHVVAGGRRAGGAIALTLLGLRSPALSAG